MTAGRRAGSRTGRHRGARAPTRSPSSPGRSCSSGGSPSGSRRASKYPWLVLATVLFGLFSVGFTITILSNSIRRIADDLGSDVSTLTWVLTGPLLAFAVFGPAAGQARRPQGPAPRLPRQPRRRRACSPALTALAPTAGALILFRVLGAATGAATGPASLAIINRLFPPSRRAQAMGYWSMVAAGGPVVGVVAGGPIVAGLRVALDLRRPGAADARDAAAGRGDPAARTRRRDEDDEPIGVRPARARPPSASARRRCCSPSTAARCGAGTHPAVARRLRPGAADARRLHRRRAAGGAPAAAARLPAAAQLLASRC